MWMAFHNILIFRHKCVYEGVTLELSWSRWQVNHSSHCLQIFVNLKSCQYNLTFHRMNGTYCNFKMVKHACHTELFKKKFKWTKVIKVKQTKSNPEAITDINTVSDFTLFCHHPVHYTCSLQILKNESLNWDNDLYNGLSPVWHQDIY